MGGSKPQQPQYIQPPPPQIIQAPAPQPLPSNTVQETSKQAYESQLQYAPQLTQQQIEQQLKYAPQLAQQATDIQRIQAPRLAQSEYDIQALLGPQYRQLYANLFPAQVQGQDTLAQQALQRLQNPYSLTPEQQNAQDTIRNREQERLLRGIRTQANLGGTLYSGNREQQERESLAELGNQYALQDIGLQQQRRAQTLQELIAASQVVFPQVQQPGVAMPSVPYQQSGFSPDALLQAVMAQSGNYIAQPADFQAGTPGRPSWLGSFTRGFSGQPMY